MPRIRVVRVRTHACMQPEETARTTPLCIGGEEEGLGGHRGSPGRVQAEYVALSIRSRRRSRRRSRADHHHRGIVGAVRVTLGSEPRLGRQRVQSGDHPDQARVPGPRCGHRGALDGLRSGCLER
jgi:hypothetical protein